MCFKQYMDSLEKVLNLGDIPRVYPGHGPVINNPTERVSAYIAHRKLRDAQILMTLEKEAKPMSSMEVLYLVERLLRLTSFWTFRSQRLCTKLFRNIYIPLQIVMFSMLYEYLFARSNCNATPPNTHGSDSAYSFGC